MATTQNLQTLTAQVSPEVLAALQEIAHHKECSQADIITELVENYVNSTAWFKAKVQRGLDDLEAGRTISHDEVKAMVRGMGFYVD